MIEDVDAIFAIDTLYEKGIIDLKTRQMYINMSGHGETTEEYEIWTARQDALALVKEELTEMRS